MLKTDCFRDPVKNTETTSNSLGSQAVRNRRYDRLCRTDNCLTFLTVKTALAWAQLRCVQSFVMLVEMNLLTRSIRTEENQAMHPTMCAKHATAVRRRFYYQSRYPRERCWCIVVKSSRGNSAQSEKPLNNRREGFLEGTCDLTPYLRNISDIGWGNIQGHTTASPWMKARIGREELLTEDYYINSHFENLCPLEWISNRSF